MKTNNLLAQSVDLWKIVQKILKCNSGLKSDGHAWIVSFSQIQGIYHIYQWKQIDRT
ncbi:MAG: hypothetical protein ACQJCO_07020 [cyanobacterium endosymbiont of Rhopalodia sterrenbergii]